MRKKKCARRPADGLTALCLSALLLTLWCQLGRTEHLSADFAWMAGVKGRGNEACCEALDCVEATVALLDYDAMESTVMIGETVLMWLRPGCTRRKGQRGCGVLSHRRRQEGNRGPMSIARGARGRSPRRRLRGRIPAAPFSSASIKRRLALQNTASMPSAHCRGAGADGGPAPAQSGGDGARTRSHLWWGYDVSTPRVPWHVLLDRRGSAEEALVCSSTAGALEPSAGATPHPRAGGLYLLGQPRETRLGLCRRCGGLPGRGGASGAEFRAVRSRPG